MVDRYSAATHRAAGGASLLERLTPVIENSRNRFGFDRCGIGFGGPVDFSNQRVVHSTHAPGWGGFDLPGYFEELAGVLPVIDNDANAGALGEALHGAGR
jgi:glucokinase